MSVEPTYSQTIAPITKQSKQWAETVAALAESAQDDMQQRAEQEEQTRMEANP